MCYKTCGPVKSGVKLETCTTAGTYSEMSGCTFNPANDFACYKIPTAANTACPAGVTPQGSMDCGTVPECTSCNSLQGIVGGQYLDSTGAPKVGWCVCQAAERQRAAHVELRERHGVAVPARLGLLTAEATSRNTSRRAG